MGAPDGYLSALADAYPTRPDIEDVLRHRRPVGRGQRGCDPRPAVGEQTATLGRSNSSTAP